MTLISSELDQKARAAEVDADYIQAALQVEANRELSTMGLISEIQLRSSEAVAEAMATRQEIEGQRLTMTAEANRAFLAAKRAEVDNSGPFSSCALTNSTRSSCVPGSPALFKRSRWKSANR